MVVAVAMFGSLTVLPALLSRLGDRVEKGRIPFVHRLRRKRRREPRSGAAILDRVLRRPVVSAVARRRPSWSRWPPGARAEDGARPASRTLPEIARSCRRYLDQKAFPAATTRPGRGQGRQRHARPSGPAIADLKRRALASAADERPIDVDTNTDAARSPRSTSRSPATAPTRLRPALDDAPQRRRCRPRSAGSTASTYAVTGDGRSARTSTTHDASGCRSCSGSS